MSYRERSVPLQGERRERGELASYRTNDERYDWHTANWSQLWVGLWYGPALPAPGDLLAHLNYRRAPE